MMKLKAAIPYFILILPVLLAFIAYSSVNWYWVAQAYDAWRIYEVLILIIIASYALFNTKVRLFFLCSTQQLRYIIPLYIGLLLIFLSSLYAEIRDFAIVEAALYFLLAIFVSVQTQLFTIYRKFSDCVAAYLAIMPLFTLIFLPLALFGRLQGNATLTWYQSFANIRMLDDALLPSLFLLWQRPAWLADNLARKKWKNISIQVLVYLTSIICMLSFLFNGARAVLLAIFLSLIVLTIFYYKNISKFLLPIISSIIAIILYFILQSFLQNPIGSSLNRTDTSGRADLWRHAIKNWQQHPLLGTGGANFNLTDWMPFAMHPHNLPLQFISEWGIGGIIILGLLAILVVRLLINYTKIPIFILGGCLAVGIDSLLSGIMVYSLSQIIGLWVLANALSYCIPKDVQLPKTDPSQVIFRLFIIFAIWGILWVHGEDMLCYHCGNDTFTPTPRFWNEGHDIHLKPLILRK